MSSGQKSLFGENETPSEISTEYDIADRYSTKDEYLKGIEKANYLIEVYSDRPEVYALRSMLYGRLENSEKELKDLSMAISVGLDNATYYCSQAIKYIKYGMFYDAIDRFSELLSNPQLRNYEYYRLSSILFRVVAYCF